MPADRARARRPRGAGRSSIPKAPVRPPRWRSPPCGSINPTRRRAAILRTHALGGDEALIKLIGEVSDAGGTAIALKTLRPTLDSPEVSDRLLAAGVDLALESFDFATAHKLADRMLANEPASGTARAQLARVLTAEGDAVAAIAVAQEAAALDPETERFAYADTLMRLDRIDEARQELESMRDRCVGARRSGSAARQARLPDGRHDRGRAPFR